MSLVISALCSRISCCARATFSAWNGGMVLRSVCASSSSSSLTTWPVPAMPHRFEQATSTAVDALWCGVQRAVN